MHPTITVPVLDSFGIFLISPRIQGRHVLYRPGAYQLLIHQTQSITDLDLNVHVR